MKPLESNTIIQDRYLIKELIGKGGMGQVYLAVDQRLGNSVALKRTTVGDDPSLADAFENEAKTLAQLRHPYLPKVSDHFVEGDEQFLVMEYIAGDDLSHRLKALNKPFPLNWVLFWADELLEALTYLHTNDPPIIHRDIKPQNLKLTSDNHIVLLDFGLSKHSVAQTRITTSGSVVGYTPHYAPMEQIRGTGTSALSDIYALSATLYHLLSNRVPPDALTRADTILSEKPDPIRPLTELNGEVTEVISDAIMKGMELNQVKRFPSAREMQKTLRKAYNELQESMSAETVAFNVADLEPESPAPEPDGDKTEVISGGIPDLPAETPAETPPAADLDKTEVIAADEMREIAGEHVPDSTQADGAAGDKTEVISAPVEPEGEEPDTMDFPSPAPGITEFGSGGAVSDAAGEFVTNEDFSPEEFKTSEDIEASGTPAVEETIAVSGPGPADTSFGDGGSDAEEDFEEADQFDEDFGDSEREVPSREPTVPAPVSETKEEKSSAGKYIAILLGLGAAMILIAGTIGVIGWYMLSDDGQEDPTPAPTPEATATEEFTPEATPSEEPTMSPEETPEESPEATRTPGSTTATPRRTPGRTPVRTPAGTPRRTPTPKPTVRKTPRTLPTILQ